jgi:hypothetical protein
MRTCVIIAMMLIVTAGAAFSQTGQQTEDKELHKSYLYKWTDDKGVVHITDGLGSVPQKYRDKALKLEQPKKEDGNEGQQVQQGTHPPSYTNEEEIEEDKKAEWQQRVIEARHRVAEAEQRYRALDQKKQEALGEGGGPLSTGHLEGRLQSEQIDREMDAVKKEIDDARHNLEVVIPEEARKAGVPPGWLRQ